MRLTDLRVAVVGGAIGGSAAALLMARAGAAVTVMERVAQPHAAGAGIGIAENGMAVLASLGLRAALDVAKEVSGARIVDAKGRLLLEPHAPAPRIAMLRRSTLHGVLMDALAAESRIVRRFGACVRHVELDGAVTFTDDGSEHVLRADLVIGADGVHSTVREMGDFGAAVRSTGIRYVRGIASAGLETGTEAWTGAGVFGSFAVDRGSYFYASCGTRAAREALDAGNLRAFRDVWASAYAPAARMLDDMELFDQLLVNAVKTVRCERWSDGVLTLVGDAAHAMAPNLGQGANSALVDAAVLLDEMQRATTLPEALLAYETRRKTAVARVATLSARLGRVAEVTTPVLRLLRDRVLMPAARMISTSKDAEMVLQESPETLFRIGHS